MCPAPPSPPTHLYKYVATAEHHFAIVANLEIRFSQPSSLNDPRDCRPNVTAPEDPAATADQIIERNLRRYDRPLTSDQIERIRQDVVRSYTVDVDQRIHESATILRRNLERSGVLSLTDTADNDVMWAHYADNHRGFVIEFDTRHSPLTQRPDESGWQGRPVPVIYRENRVQVPCDSANLHLPDELLLVKTSAWQYEREWRIVRDRAQASQTLSHGGTEISLFSIAPDAISTIYIGSNASAETERRLLAIVAANDALLHVRLVRAEISVQGDVVLG